MLGLLLGFTAAAVAAPELRWEKLAPIPDPIGFAGAFAGVNGGALLVAGGANFPERKPWEGGRKVWHDSVFVLEQPGGVWHPAGHLPLPLAYGVALSHRRGLICIGGSDARQHHASALVLRWTKGRLEVEPLLGLPQDCANMSGALIGDTVHIAGGTAKPDSTHALSTFFSMNLSSKRPGWRTLPAVPGPGRMLSVAGAHDGAFYLFGGAALQPGPDGKHARVWLREAWRFTPRQGWKRLADLPRAAVAAPSPAPVVGGKLLILGGDDGAQVSTPPGEHKGFPRDVLAYDPKTDRWERLGELPFSLVTTPAVRWQDRLIVPGGESNPGVRSTEVWAGHEDKETRRKR